MSQFITNDNKNKQKNSKGVKTSSSSTSTSTTDKRDIKHKYYTRGSKNKNNYKQNMSSDDDDDAGDDDDAVDNNDDELEDEINEIKKNDMIEMKDYRELLTNLFPSQYMKEKTKNTPRGKKLHEFLTTPISDKNSYENTKVLKPTTNLALSPPPSVAKRPPENIKLKHKKEKSKYNNKNFSIKNEDEYTSVTSSNEDNSSDDEDKDKDNIDLMNDIFNKNNNKKLSKFNIIFNVGDILGHNKYDDDEEYDIDDDYYDSDYDDDSDFDDYDDSEDDNNETGINKITNVDKKNSNKAKSVKELDTKDTEENNKLVFSKFNTMINSLSVDERNNPVISNMILDIKKKETEFQKSQEKKIKRNKLKNTRKFSKLLKEKDVMNDVRFFKEKISCEEQESIIKQIEEIKQFSDVEKPYRLLLIEANIPIPFKACAYKKINTLKYMEPGAGEYYKIKNWVDTFMQIPFNKYKTLPITFEDGVEKCHEFMDNAKKVLDNAVYGLNDAKLQIMQMIGQLLVNPTAVGTAIAIKGPMGTGKTTLIKDGISKILGRDFAFIALGGATDSSFLEGHSYTYEGSSWGKIVDIIIKCKCMNPVIYFDELDKVSDTPRGEEIIGILTHLTDTTQNSKFHDKYFAEIDFDLSRCLFIFSYNDESKVNPILRDRMYRIHTKGYDQSQKTIISLNYLLPTIRNQVRFEKDDISIPDETIHYIITNHTDKEDGVRNLKRCLEIIHTKLNLYRLMKPDTNLFEGDISLKVNFPLVVTNEIVDKLIKKNVDNGAWTTMYS